MTTVLITGAQGFVGQHLTRYLARQSVEVIGVGHGAWPELEYRRLGLNRWVSGSVTAANLDIAIKGLKSPDFAFHLAGGSSVGFALGAPLEDFERTVGSTAALLGWIAVKSPATKLVMASSAAVYGQNRSIRISENEAPNPYSLYGAHKLMAETECRAYGESCGVQCVVARLFSVYGVGLKKQLLWDTCTKLQTAVDAIELGGTGDESRDWISVDAAVSALWKIAGNASEQVPIVNVGTGIATSVREVINNLLEAWPHEGKPLRSVKFSGVSRKGDPKNLIADVTKLNNLGVNVPSDLKHGIAICPLVQVAAFAQMRVALKLIDPSLWRGGYNYQLNFSRALAEQRALGAIPVVLTEFDKSDKRLLDLAKIEGLEVVSDSRLAAVGSNVSLAKAIALGGDRAVLRVLRDSNIDLIIESANYYGWRLPIPSLAWIPDLQHRALPDQFTKFQCLRREIGFQTQLLSGRQVLLSSQDAKRQCERAYPRSRGRTHVVRFAFPPKASPQAESHSTLDKYGISGPYVFCPNQFYRHKNHRLIIQALKYLRDDGKSVRVICSGQEFDPRDSGYFGKLARDVDLYQVRDSFRSLGSIPYEDMMVLLDASSALLNASMYEGWSTTVEEARPLGVRMILSDLPVHREQAEGLAEFFDPRSPIQLAGLLWKSVERPSDRNPPRAMKNARFAYDRFTSDLASLLACYK